VALVLQSGTHVDLSFIINVFLYSYSPSPS